MSEIAWFVLSASDRSELGRVTGADKPAAEEEAATLFPGIRVVVQSVASARCAAREPSPARATRRSA